MRGSTSPCEWMLGVWGGGSLNIVGKHAHMLLDIQGCTVYSLPLVV